MAIQNKNSLQVHKSKEAPIRVVNQIQRNTPRVATTSLQRLVPISGNHYTFITQRNVGREMHGNMPQNIIITPTSANSMNGAHNSDHSLTPQIIDHWPESVVIGQSNICVSKPN